MVVAEGEEVAVVPVKLLRWSLAITFIWFGILKLIGVSPVLLIIQKAMPAFLGSSPLFLMGLAMGEIVVGLGLLFQKTTKIASILMIVHLTIASLSVLVTQGFKPFPVLTLEGEFVVKNLVLIAAGYLLIVSKIEEKSEQM